MAALKIKKEVEHMASRVMTNKEKEIYERIKSKSLPLNSNLVNYSDALKCLKEYTYEDKKKIIEGMRMRGYIKYLSRHGYITHIEFIE